MSTRAAILAELRSLRAVAGLCLPRAERADVSRRIRNYQKELVALRGGRPGARRRKAVDCLGCGNRIKGRPYLVARRAFCSESCFDVHEDERFRP